MIKRKKNILKKFISFNIENCLYDKFHLRENCFFLQSPDIVHTFIMALYHLYHWDDKNDFAYVLEFFPDISDIIGSVKDFRIILPRETLKVLAQDPHWLGYKLGVG